MGMVKVRKCRKCGRIYENLCILRCKCKEDLPMEPEYIETEPEEQSVEEIIWYKKCKICHAEYRLNSRDQIIFQCEQCGDIDISNQGIEDTYTKSGQLGNQSKEPLREVFVAKGNRRQVEGDNTTEDKTMQKEVDNEVSISHIEQKHDFIRFVELRNMLDGKMIRVYRGTYMLGGLGEIEREYFASDKYVGRQHMMIFVEKDSVAVMDNESKNWTKINGERIVKKDGKKQIESGDQLTLADLTFEVLVCR